MNIRNFILTLILSFCGLTMSAQHSSSSHRSKTTTHSTTRSSSSKKSSTHKSSSSSTQSNTVVCPECNGKGKITCPDCDGTLDCEIDGELYLCETCTGCSDVVSGSTLYYRILSNPSAKSKLTGKIKCPTCNGKKRVPKE